MDKVPFLTVSEFDSVPKYMRGRMTYDSLNAAVSEYNSALEEKYAFLAKGFQAMGSIKDKKRFKEFRSQVQKIYLLIILVRRKKQTFNNLIMVFFFGSLLAVLASRLYIFSLFKSTDVSIFSFNCFSSSPLSPLVSQETRECKGVCFLVADDLRLCPSLKTETNRRVVFTILRHCHRIRELRKPGAPIKYAAVRQ